MSAPRTLAILVNPGARDGGTHARLDRLLARHPVVARAVAGVWPVRNAADARRALGEAPLDALVVAAGGDGTVNLAAQALLEAEARTLAVLPLGTGNAFAHAMGVGAIDAALEALLSGADRRVDVMRTTHPGMPAALVSISVGFESLLLAALARHRRASRAWGLARGLPAGLRASRTGVVLTLDGHPALAADERFYNAGLYAEPCYAFGRRVVPEADPCDGHAEARVHAGPVGYWLSLAGRRTLTPTWRVARIESPLPLQADGEAIPPGAFDVRVAPGALVVRTRPA